MQKIHEMNDETFVRNIVTVYQSAIRLGKDLASREWYTVARNDCKALAEQHNLSLETIVGMTAALSPGMNWEYNVRATGRVIQCRSCGAYGANIKKAKQILAGEKPLDILGGQKVRSFYKNIISSGKDCSSVTIARWAVRVALGKDTWATPQAAPTKKQYMRLEEAYKSTSRDLQIPVTELQAITWSHVKHLVKNPIGENQLTLLGA